MNEQKEMAMTPVIVHEMAEYLHYKRERWHWVFHVLEAVAVLILAFVK